ncbi:hypothetical protein Ahia01_000608600 [Argonauta hians]
MSESANSTTPLFSTENRDNPNEETHHRGLSYQALPFRRSSTNSPPPEYTEMTEIDSERETPTPRPTSTAAPPPPEYRRNREDDPNVFEKHFLLSSICYTACFICLSCTIQHVTLVFQNLAHIHLQAERFIIAMDFIIILTTLIIIYLLYKSSNDASEFSCNDFLVCLTCALSKLVSAAMIYSYLQDWSTLVTFGSDIVFLISFTLLKVLHSRDGNPE